jgi:hypothetical protein
MNKQRSLIFLLVGDVTAVLVVSIVGFASHQLSVFNPRLLATFFPMLTGWLAAAPWLGLYDPSVRCRVSSWWRVLLAVALAAPLAAWLRALWLGGAPIQPVFVAVLGGVSAVGMLLWRLLWAFVCVRNLKNG